MNDEAARRERAPSRAAVAACGYHPRMAAKKKAAGGKRKWSARVTATSDALDIAGGTFAKDDPKAIAHELERDAEKSTRRKSSPYRSAMSMLTFYINRAGANLPAARRKILEDAKDVLREEFGPKTATRKKTAGRKKTTARKKTAR
jgi:hypothetical protein